MSAWFERREAGEGPGPAERVLVTGAAGRIGSAFVRACAERYHFTLMARPGEATDAVEGCGRIARAELTDRNRLDEVMAGHDAVLHLAANPSAAATWADLLEPNIIGAESAFAAARAAGVGRFVFASSVNAVNGAPRARQVHADDPPAPGNLYGASKAFGEALARYYATREGLCCYVVRIGAFASTRDAAPARGRPTRIGVSARDLNQLFRLCLEDTALRFAVLHGLSANDADRMDTSGTRELLAYEPRDVFDR